VSVPWAEGYTVPTYGRLAFVDDVASMAVVFTSNSSSNAPMAQYSSSPPPWSSGEALVALGTSATYTAAQMCGPPANNVTQLFFREPGFQHTVR
jgi:hypothetical protein